MKPNSMQNLRDVDLGSVFYTSFSRDLSNTRTFEARQKPSIQSSEVSPDNSLPHDATKKQRVRRENPGGKLSTPSSGDATDTTLLLNEVLEDPEGPLKKSTFQDMGTSKAESFLNQIAHSVSLILKRLQSELPPMVWLGGPTHLRWDILSSATCVGCLILLQDYYGEGVPKNVQDIGVILILQRQTPSLFEILPFNVFIAMILQSVSLSHSTAPSMSFIWYCCWSLVDCLLVFL